MLQTCRGLKVSSPPRDVTKGSDVSPQRNDIAETILLLRSVWSPLKGNEKSLNQKVKLNTDGYKQWAKCVVFWRLVKLLFNSFKARLKSLNVDILKQLQWKLPCAVRADELLQQDATGEPAEASESAGSLMKLQVARVLSRKSSKHEKHETTTTPFIRE